MGNMMANHRPFSSHWTSARHDALLNFQDLKTKTDNSSKSNCENTDHIVEVIFMHLEAECFAIRFIDPAQSLWRQCIKNPVSLFERLDQLSECMINTHHPRTHLFLIWSHCAGV